jgi:protein TonB
MFTDMVESASSERKTDRGWAVMVSVLFQLAWLIILILIPLIYTPALPKAILSTVLIAPGARQPSPAADAAVHTSVRRTTGLLDEKILHAPSMIPGTVVPKANSDLAPDTPTTVGPVPSFDSVRALTSPTILPPPDTPPQDLRVTTRIRLGGQVQAAKIISQPQPVYPALARQARIQGDVVLHAIIGQDGRVNELQVISGHPLLVKAALDSVKQWRYQPTLLNDEPVEVDTTITVTFVLG